MEVYYTVDSAKGLFQFCEVELGHYTPKEAELAAFLNQIHPEGLSKHGYINLCNPGIMMDAHTDLSQTFLVGLVFELVRRSCFPENHPAINHYLLVSKSVRLSNSGNYWQMRKMMTK